MQENVTEKKRKLIELNETFFTPFSVREFQEFFFNYYPHVQSF